MLSDFSDGSGKAPWAAATGADEVPPGFWAGTLSMAPGMLRAPGLNTRPSVDLRLIGDEQLVGIIAISPMLVHLMSASYHILGIFAMHIDQLSDEHLDHIHAGSAPLEPHDRRAYYNEILALLSGCSDPPSNRTVIDLVRLAQGKFIRSAG
jgi:hypothetical protein